MQYEPFQVVSFTMQYELFLVVSFITVQYELFLASFITVQYELLLEVSFVVLCIGRIICYCAICPVLAVSFVTVQYEVCHAVSVVTECELCVTVICCVLCLTVICCVLFLAVPFITVQYELFWQCELLLCNNSYFRQHRLCYCVIWAMSGSVIYCGAISI